MKPPTASQMQAVEEVEQHLLVNAGAGTGKTSTVVAKILYHLGVAVGGRLVGVPLRLADIAAITYTNRAAADLKKKLRAALREAGRRDLAYEVDRARIGTIHSFCGDVLREFALRGGYDPPGRILEEGESNALAAEAAREALVDAVQNGTIEELSALLSAYKSRDVEKWVARLAGDASLLRRLHGRSAHGAPAERALLELASAAHVRLRARLDAMEALDFDRMIVDTRDLIIGQPHVRAALRRRIRLLIVDEFQDVDPAQKEIAYALGEPEARHADTPRLMLVGDPKQSIYRFRRADVTVWTAVEADFRDRGLGRIVELRESFRTVEPVLAFVEASVGRVMDDYDGGAEPLPYEVKFLRVDSRRTDGPADHAVELFLVPPDDDGKARSVAEVRDADAAGVARRMLELHEEGIAWKEMAILLVGWSDLDRYHKALESAGIPAYALRGIGFYGRPEIVDMITALEAVRDPNDNRALLGFLRSPFVGVKDETLLEIALANRATPQASYWSTLNDAPTAEPELIRRARDLVEEFSVLRDRIAPADLLRALLHDTGYLAHLALFAEGDRAIANVRRFIADADEMAEGGVGNLLRMIAEQRARDDKVAEARIFAEDDDVVTITSVHSAKGLEWRVVFWCDLCREPTNDHDRCIIGRDELRLADPDLPAREQPQEVIDLRAREANERRAERKRLWYVAATRARDRLVLSGIPLGGAPKGSPAEMLFAAFPGLAGADGEIEYAGADGASFRAAVQVLEPADVSEEALQELPVLPAAILPPALDAIAAPLGRGRHSATALIARERCEHRHWLQYVMGLREPARQGALKAEFESAVVSGRIIHDIAQHEQEQRELDELLEEAVGRWAPDAPPPESSRGAAFRKRLRDEAEALRAHESFRSLADAAHARHELAFVYLTEDGDRFEGSIDLAAPGPAGHRLLDVKTGNVSAADAPHRATHYAPQRELYVLATEAIAQTEVAEFSFLFTGAGHNEAVPVTSEQRATVRARIGQAIAAIGTGAHAKTTNPDECRFCGFKQAGLCMGAAEGDSI